MSHIQKSDLRQISYQEFGQLLESLTQQITDYQHQRHLTFDLVIPILRSGAMAGIHLASKLNITHVLPVQYKYRYQPKEAILTLLQLPTPQYPIKPNSNILIADTNAVWGDLASKAIRDIHQQFPQAKAFFASTILDYSIQQLPHIHHIFYGSYSNNKRTLTPDEAQQLGISNDIRIFPWEDLDQQWQDISSYTLTPTTITHPA